MDKGLWWQAKGYFVRLKAKFNLGGRVDFAWRFEFCERNIPSFSLLHGTDFF